PAPDALRRRPHHLARALDGPGVAEPDPAEDQAQPRRDRRRAPRGIPRGPDRAGLDPPRPPRRAGAEEGGVIASFVFSSTLRSSPRATVFFLTRARVALMRVLPVHDM